MPRKRPPDDPMQSGRPHAPKCGATCRDGHLCTNDPMRGKKRCRMHGGKSLSGIASPSAKHLGYSSVLPKRMLDRYLANEANPDRLALTAEIALLDARLGDLLARVDSGESGDAWRLIGDAFAALRGAMGGADPAETAAALKGLGEVIARGTGDYAAWGEVRGVVQDRRRLVEAEQKRLVAMNELVRVDSFMALVKALTESVRLHVHEPGTLAAIDGDFRRLLAIGRPGE